MKGAGGRCVYGRSVSSATTKVASRNVAASVSPVRWSSRVTPASGFSSPLSGSKSRPLATRAPSSSTSRAATVSPAPSARSRAATSQ